MSDVRAMLACLANEQVAEAFANTVLRLDPIEGFSPVRAEKAVVVLERSGLITREEDNLLLAAGQIRAMLRDMAGASVHSSPADAWLDGDGRIRQYPRRTGERHELFNHVGQQVVAVRKSVKELELSSRLEQFTADIPTLRRYLGVYGVLGWEADGSAYWRAGGRSSRCEFVFGGWATDDWGFRNPTRCLAWDCMLDAARIAGPSIGVLDDGSTLAKERRSSFSSSGEKCPGVPSALYAWSRRRTLHNCAMT